MLAIRRAFGEVARRNRLNLYGEHGHGGERYSENELLHVNLRRLSNRHRPPWRAGAVLNRRTPDGSAAMHPTQERRFVRPAPTLWRARPARPVLRSSVQVPCNHSCEAIAPVRLISVHRRRNLNGDSLMHTVDRGREWPYFDVSHCSTLQSGGSAVSRTRRAAERNGFGSRAGFACRQSEATINKREAPEPVGDGGKPGASVQTEQSHIYRNLRSPHAEAALILNFLYYIYNHFTRQYSCIGITPSCGRPVMAMQRKHQQLYNRRASCKLPSMRLREAASSPYQVLASGSTASAAPTGW
jgi:hypothetical protein